VKAEMGCAVEGASSQPFMWLVEPVYQKGTTSAHSSV